MIIDSNSRWIAGAMTEQIRQVRPIVSVDLGFSGKEKTTGICTAALNGDGPLGPGSCYSFAGAIDKVAGSLRLSSEAVLIIEAPLSACFGELNNPCPRRPFESRLSKGKKSNRYWYTGAGASTMLAAVFFLRNLDQQLARLRHQGKIHLFEGFLSYKQKRSDHVWDAFILLRKFLMAGECCKMEKLPKERFISVLDVFAGGEGDPSVPEVIVIGRKGS